MTRYLAVTLLAAAFSLAGCGSSADTAANTVANTGAAIPDVPAAVSESSVSEDASTTKGAGDLSSSAGAGTTTGAMDGGSAGKGQQPAGAGGAGDALGGGDQPTDKP